MSVVIAFEDAGPCRKQLTIEVPAPAVEAEFGRVARDWTKQVKLPGFRKGKAPLKMIKRRFGSEINQEVAERLVPRYWRQAEAEKSLDLLLAPEFSDLELELGEPMTFNATVEIRPQIDLKLEPEIELPDGATEATEAEIDDAVEELRRQHADWHAVERSAAVGDRVVGTIYKDEDAPAGDDGEEAEPAPATPLDVEIGDARVWEELSLALTGVSAGQKGSFKRQGDGPDEGELAYRFEVEEVRERELPPLDDDFAAKLEVETLDEMRERLKENLSSRKDEQLRQQRREALADTLRERHPLELPARVVDQQVQEMLHQQMSRLAQQGVDLESAPIDWAGIGEQMRPDAEKLVHERLVLDAVAKDRDMQVDEESFERLLGAFAAQQGKTPLALRQELADSGRLPLLRGQLLRDQVVRFLLGEEAAESDAADAETNEES